MGTQLYGYTRDEHEYSVSVPQINTDDAELTICLSAHGGGTVGESYRANGWDYAVYDAGELVIEGSDIRSSDGRAAGHAEMAVSLAGFLGAAGEHFWFRGSDDANEYDQEYSADEAAWLAVNYERLGCFASDSE